MISFVSAVIVNKQQPPLRVAQRKLKVRPKGVSVQHEPPGCDRLGESTRLRNIALGSRDRIDSLDRNSFGVQSRCQ